MILNGFHGDSDFTTACAETGGEPVAGFVIRTHITGPFMKGKDMAAYLYILGSSLVFKNHCDELYVMYRD